MVVVVVSLLGHNLAIDDADFCPPCLLCRPFFVVKDNDRSEVAVYPHSVPLQFLSKRCRAFDVGDDRLPPIEKIVTAMFTNCRLMSVASGLYSPSVISVNS